MDLLNRGQTPEFLYSHKDCDLDELEDDVEIQKASRVAHALPSFKPIVHKKDSIQSFAAKDKEAQHQ